MLDVVGLARFSTQMVEVTPTVTPRINSLHSVLLPANGTRFRSTFLIAKCGITHTLLEGNDNGLSYQHQRPGA